MPPTWRYRLRRDRYSRFEKHPQFRLVRHDLQRIPISDDAFIDVFWKALPIGRGPAASVVVHDQEVLRFDCFGPGKGHLHASFFQQAPAPELRLFFSEPTICQQIDRAAFEVTRNLPYYTQRSPYAAVRRFRIDDEQLRLAGDQMRTILADYILVSTQ